MSTIQSSTEHLTLNADGAGKEIKFQANGVEKASISSAGAFTSTSIDATKLSGALPAIDGSALTNLPGGGKVLQVVTHRDDTRSVYASGNEHFPSEWSINITPISSTSMLILTCTLFLETDYNTVLKINKNGSIITDAGYEGYNSDAGNQRWSGLTAGGIYDGDVATTPNTKTFQYFVPSNDTASRSYGISVRTAESNNHTLWVNRSANNDGSDSVEVGCSVMTIMEVEQ